MRGITKRFPGVVALDRVSLGLGRGEILALMGENGAGKSTLLKILAGVYAPDEGEVLLQGKPVRVHSVASAKALGVGVIYQELMLAANLDVAANIFLGNEPRAGILGALNRKRMWCEAEKLLKKVGLNVSPDTPTRQLTTGQMQMVEICKALNQNARILVLDEPTASLSFQETERLLALIAELRASGISMLYVSHRMEEVFRIADRITVLRDGCHVGDLAVGDATPAKVVSMMVGRDLTSCFPHRRSQPGERVLSVDNVVVPGSPAGVSFDAHRGEILGFAGLVGSGRTELMQVVAGLTRALSGKMLFESQAYAPRHMADAIRRGVYLVPEDRKLQGLVLPMSIAENISLPDLKNYRPRWRFDFKRQQRTAESAVAQLQIRPGTIDRRTAELSGGNQQKVVLAKWLAMTPNLLILDEPTRGIDVGAKAELYSRIVELAEGGLTILLVSSDLEEILGLSDRIAVMRNRRMVALIPREEMTRERVGFLMTSEGRAA